MPSVGDYVGLEHLSSIVVNLRPMWEILFGWTLVGIAVPTLNGIGVGVMSMAPPEFQIAKFCFALTGVIFVARVSLWLGQDNGLSIGHRGVLAFVVFGLTGVACIESWRWVESRQKNNEKSTLPETIALAPTKVPLMPSLLSLYMTDFKSKGSGGGVSIHADAYADLTFPNNEQLRFFYSVNEDHGSRAKFMSFYIPDSQRTYEAIEFLATGYKQYISLPIGFETGGAHSPSSTRSDELIFTGRVFIYHEKSLTLSQLGKLADIYANQHLTPEFRSTSYALSVWESITHGNTKPPAEYELRDGIPQIAEIK